MAIPELGAKQICPQCQTKFYDLGRRPATCPKCQHAFDPEEAIRSRRVRARATPAEYETEEETEDKGRKKPAEGEDGFEDEVEDTPEIDEVVEESGDWWVDMETKVRSHGDGKFDLGKVEHCLEIADPYVVTD